MCREQGSADTSLRRAESLTWLKKGRRWGGGAFRADPGVGQGAGRPEVGLELCVSRSRGSSRMAGGWSSSFPLPLPPPLMAAPVQLCQRQDWLFIHPLIVLIRDSNYPLRSSDYPELQEGDLTLSCCGSQQQHSLRRKGPSGSAWPTVPGSQSVLTKPSHEGVTGAPPESAAPDVKQEFPLDYLCHCVESTDERFGSGNFKAR